LFVSLRILIWIKLFYEAADMMSRKRTDLLFVTKNRKEIIGVLYNDVIVTEAIAGKKDLPDKSF
jgi:hypothetical protein